MPESVCVRACACVCLCACVYSAEKGMVYCLWVYDSGVVCGSGGMGSTASGHMAQPWHVVQVCVCAFDRISSHKTL